MGLSSSGEALAASELSILPVVEAELVSSTAGVSRFAASPLVSGTSTSSATGVEMLAMLPKVRLR